MDQDSEHEQGERLPRQPAARPCRTVGQAERNRAGDHQGADQHAVTAERDPVGGGDRAGDQPGKRAAEQPGHRQQHGAPVHDDARGEGDRNHHADQAHGPENHPRSDLGDPRLECEKTDAQALQQAERQEQGCGLDQFEDHRRA